MTEKKKIALTVDPENYDYLKNAGFKASRFFDTAIFALRTNILISELQNTTFTSANHEKKTGLKGFEPLTYGLRVLSPLDSESENKSVLSALDNNLKISEPRAPSDHPSETVSRDPGEGITFTIDRGNGKETFTTYARKIHDTPARYFFDYAACLYVGFITRSEKSQKYKSDLTNTAANLLSMGKIIKVKKDARQRYSALDVEIDYDTIQAYQDKHGRSGSSARINTAKQFLKYWSTRWSDPTLNTWIGGMKWNPEDEKRAFTLEGEKADIDKEDVIHDMQAFLKFIKDPKTQYVSKKTGIRALITLLFGISTGMRPEEINRVSYSELFGYKEDKTIMYGKGTVTIPKGSNLLKAEKAKTSVDRIIPIHPKIRPYLELLKTLDPSQPFKVNEYSTPKKNAGSSLQVRQFRNFAVKYWRDYGHEEIKRILIMGHDEKIGQKEIAGEISKGMGGVYGKFSPKEITDHYLKTVGKNFDPTFGIIDIKDLKAVIAEAPPAKTAPAKKAPASQGTPGRPKA